MDEGSESQSCSTDSVVSATLTKAQPHPSIPTETYASLIDRDLSEPLRMRQLLLWCTLKSMESFPCISSHSSPSNTDHIGTLLYSNSPICAGIRRSSHHLKTAKHKLVQSSRTPQNSPRKQKRNQSRNNHTPIILRTRNVPLCFVLSLRGGNI